MNTSKRLRSMSSVLAMIRAASGMFFNTVFPTFEPRNATRPLHLVTWHHSDAYYSKLAQERAETKRTRRKARNLRIVAAGGTRMVSES